MCAQEIVEAADRAHRDLRAREMGFGGGKRPQASAHDKERACPVLRGCRAVIRRVCGAALRCVVAPRRRTLRGVR